MKKDNLTINEMIDNIIKWRGVECKETIDFCFFATEEPIEKTRALYKKLMPKV